MSTLYFVTFEGATVETFVGRDTARTAFEAIPEHRFPRLYRWTPGPSLMRSRGTLLEFTPGLGWYSAPDDTPLKVWDRCAPQGCARPISRLGERKAGSK